MACRALAGEAIRSHRWIVGLKLCASLFLPVGSCTFKTARPGAIVISEPPIVGSTVGGASGSLSQEIPLARSHRADRSGDFHLNLYLEHIFREASGNEGNLDGELRICEEPLKGARELIEQVPPRAGVALSPEAQRSTYCLNTSAMRILIGRNLKSWECSRIGGYIVFSWGN
jgi:hypothetical protein